MSSYRGTADRRDRTEAIIAVIVVHAILAAIIVTGLNMGQFRRIAETITTVTLDQPEEPPPPPPPEPAKPAPEPEQPKKEAAPPAPKDEPTPVVAPPPKLPEPSPIPAAKVPGAGSSANSGASTAGTGTGAGGAGTGTGGGGYGDTSQFTPARLITKIPNSEYARLSATGMEHGRVGVTVLVHPDGNVSNCRITQTSGDQSIDTLMCQLSLRYLRFTPARDPTGRPIAQDITFFPDWHR